MFLLSSPKSSMKQPNCIMTGESFERDSTYQTITCTKILTNFYLLSPLHDEIKFKIQSYETLSFSFQLTSIIRQPVGSYTYPREEMELDFSYQRAIHCTLFHYSGQEGLKSCFPQSQHNDCYLNSKNGMATKTIADFSFHGSDGHSLCCP